MELAPAPIQYVASLNHVREVSLLGVADLKYWKALLEKESLEPQELDGKAQILILGAEAKFRGIRFRELSFSVMVQGGMFLVRAFNSVRFFAFCERVFFSTPYYRAKVRVSTAAPMLLRMESKEGLFEVVMMGRGQASSGDPDGWEGPVFLPGSAKAFVARIAGQLLKYPFQPTLDSMSIKPAASDGLLNMLLDSNFSPIEWLVRADAAHAKSKTYSREKALALSAKTSSS